MTSMRLVLLVSVIVATAACGTTGASPPLTMSATTLTAGWEQHFTLEWTADPGKNGARRVAGYIHNRHGEFAMNVRVLAQALDPAGAIVGQRIAWVVGGVPGFGRAYFQVTSLPVAENYRVSIWEYTWLQADSDKN